MSLFPRKDERFRSNNKVAVDVLRSEGEDPYHDSESKASPKSERKKGQESNAAHHPESIDSNVTVATATSNDESLVGISSTSPSTNDNNNNNNNNTAIMDIRYPTVEQEVLLADRAKNKSRCLVYACGLCASLTSILLGYDVGIMAVAKKYVDKDLRLSDDQSEIIMGSLNLVAALGGLIAGRTADMLGRNRAIGVACVIFLVGSTIMTLAFDYSTLLLGRVVTGLGVGCGFVIAPVYIAEITPPDIRGRLVSMTDVCINVGIVLGSLVGFICEQIMEHNTDMIWRVMLGIGLIPPVIILITLRFLPESPRWLLHEDRVHEARTVLRLIMGSEADADAEVISIKEAIQLERDVTSAWSEVLCPRHRSIFRVVAIGLGLGFFQQASGSEAAVYYSPSILSAIGIGHERTRSLANIAVSACKFMGEIVAMFTMDKVGRKPLFLLSAFGCTLFLSLVGLCFQLSWSPYLVIIFLCLFMALFSVGLGAITFVVASEVFPLSVRGKAMALTVFVNRLMSGVVALSFLSMVDTVTYAGAFFFFSIVSFLSIFFYAIVVPETKGKTLEEISALFESQDPSLTHHYPPPSSSQRHSHGSSTAGSSGSRSNGASSSYASSVSPTRAAINTITNTTSVPPPSRASFTRLPIDDDDHT